MGRRKEKIVFLYEEVYYLQKVLCRYYLKDEETRRALRLLAIKLGDISPVKVTPVLRASRATRKKTS